MCMDEFVKRLYDFRGIYRIFLESKQSSLIFYRYFFTSSSICAPEIKFQNFVEISGIFDISTIFLIFLRFFGQSISGWQFCFGALR